MGIIKKILNNIRAPRVEYQPLIEVRIFKNAILHNLHEYQNKYPQVKFAPVLKSNAYGHGLVEIAAILDKEDIAFFMVDSFYEALVLRRHDTKSKVVIFGYVRDEQILTNRLKDCSFGIIGLEQIQTLGAKLTHPQK